MQSRVVLAGQRSWPAVQEGFWLQEVVGRGVSSAWTHGRAGERNLLLPGLLPGLLLLLAQ